MVTEEITGNVDFLLFWFELYCLIFYYLKWTEVWMLMILSLFYFDWFEVFGSVYIVSVMAFMDLIITQLQIVLYLLRNLIWVNYTGIIRGSGNLQPQLNVTSQLMN